MRDLDSEIGPERRKRRGCRLNERELNMERVTLVLPWDMEGHKIHFFLQTQYFLRIVYFGALHFRLQPPELCLT